MLKWLEIKHYTYTLPSASMNLLFDDNGTHLKLAPLTLTRPVAELRMGVMTFSDSWVHALKKYHPIDRIGHRTEHYLSEKYPPLQQAEWTIAGNVKPTASLAELVAQLDTDTKLLVNGTWVATRGKGSRSVHAVLRPDDLICITALWQLFQRNEQAILSDVAHIERHRSAQLPSSTNQVIGKHPLFVGEGARVECAILNVEKGPLVIGDGAVIMEGSVVRGPASIGDHAVVKSGARIGENTTIGPHCKVGGEVSNVLFQGYSNKGHDGFLGNSLIGEWCNLGAGTTTSNLKNNYSNVRLYSYVTQEIEPTGHLFFGTVMGDHVKTSIHTMLNTGTSIGVCATVFSTGFPPKFIPSFSWGGGAESPTSRFESTIETAQNMMKRRALALSKADKRVLTHLFDKLA